MTNYDALGHCFLTHKRSKVIVCPVSMQHVTSEDKGNFPLIYIYIYIYIYIRASFTLQWNVKLCFTVDIIYLEDFSPLGRLYL